MDSKLLYRILKVVDGDDLFWFPDEDEEDVTVGTNANDLFAWACADTVKITEENVHILEQAHADLKAISEDLTHHADLLFSCRVEGMRPQNPYYKSLDPRIWPLLDACGPERKDTGKRPEYVKNEWFKDDRMEEIIGLRAELARARERGEGRGGKMKTIWVARCQSCLEDVFRDSKPGRGELETCDCCGCEVESAGFQEQEATGHERT